MLHGFRYEAVLHNPRQRECSEQLDVLCDGPFVKALRDGRSSSAGRATAIINVPESLRQGTVVLLPLDGPAPARPLRSA